MQYVKSFINRTGEKRHTDTGCRNLCGCKGHSILVAQAIPYAMFITFHYQ